MIRMEWQRRFRVTGQGLVGAVLGGLLAASWGSAAMAAPLVTALGGPRDFGEQQVARSDDGSSAAIDITPVFGPAGVNFFGASYASLFININGNLTFAAPLQEFTPFGIPGSAVPIVAAFFADVDTRGNGTPPESNAVYYDLDTTSRVFTATWDSVGYFAGHTDKRNSFQIRLIDRGSGDFDMEWRYERLEWTTGDASGGSGGLGGTPARAGYARGNGGTFLEFPESGDQTAMLDLVNRSNVREAGRFVFTVRGGQVFFCGNGEREAGEECDPQAPANGCTGTDACRADCTCGPCGNGIVEPGEECDGNADSACPGGCIGETLAGECACMPAFEEACAGDCDRSGAVSVAEAVVCASIASGSAALTSCRQCDADGDGVVTRGEVGTATAHAIGQCPNLGVCGNGVQENVEECDDGGTCVGGTAAGSACAAATDCPQGACLPFGGDGCAANCTPESDVLFDLVTGQVTDTGPVDGTSVLESRTGTLVGSPPAVQQTYAFPANGRLVLTVGKTRSGQRPVVVRANGLSSTASLEGLTGTVCACVRPVTDAVTHGPGNAGSGVIDCLGIDGVDTTVTVTAGQGSAVARAGLGAPGSARLRLQTELAQVFGQCFGTSAAYGADGQFCTGDDGTPDVRTVLGLEATTGTASVSVRLQNGQGIGPFSANGAAFDCSALAAGQTTGTELAVAAGVTLGAPPVPYVGTAVNGVLVAGPSTCGDGNHDAGEECDDGNTLNGDCCSSTCALDTVCTDGNPCTDGDTCSGLTCVSGPPKNCSDNNVCTADSCNPASGCVWVAAPGSCNDGNACTTGDTCAGTQCTGTAVDCSDTDPCTAEKCEPSAGCQYPPTICNDKDSLGRDNLCTIDTCNSSSGCVFTPAVAGQPCDDLDFCNGVDTCDGNGVCEHKGDPCVGGFCGECFHEVWSNGVVVKAGYCNKPAGTRCADEGDSSTAADKCDAAGFCHGQIPASVFAVLAPVAPAPRSLLMLGPGAKVTGHLCAETLDGRRGATVFGDAVAMPLTGVAARFSGAAIENNLVTGGGDYRGRVSVKGRRDKSGTGIEVADCAHAVEDTAARLAALKARPATLTLQAQRVAARSVTTIPASGQLPAGEVVVQIDGDLRVGPKATVQLTGGPGTTRAIVRVKGRLFLDTEAAVKGDPTLGSDEVIILVDKEAYLRGGARVGGTLATTEEARAVAGATVDGQLISGTDVKLYRDTKVGGVAYVGW